MYCWVNWVVFAVGAALALCGISRLLRHKAYLRAAGQYEGIARSNQEAVWRIKDMLTRKPHVGDVRYFDAMAKDMDKEHEQLKKSGRGLRVREIAMYAIEVRTGKEDADYLARLVRKLLDSGDDNILQDIRDKYDVLDGRAHYFREVSRRLRDYAVSEVAWTAALFASGALVVALFRLLVG